MKRWRVKFARVVKQTAKAVCLERWDEKGIVWLPSKCISLDARYTKGVAFILPDWLYKEKELSGKIFEPYHHPDKIDPVYNQEPLDELKC